MAVNTKKRGFLLSFVVLFLIAGLFLFCSCGKSPVEPEPENNVPTNVNTIMAFYDNEPIVRDNTLQITQKSDGTVLINVNGKDVSYSNLDWSKLEVHYTLDDSDEDFVLEDVMKHTKVFSIKNGIETEVQQMPTISRNGEAYKIVISYGQDTQFIVLISKESQIQDLKLVFNANNKIAEDYYEFEYSSMSKQDFSAMVGDDYSTNYKYARISVKEYKEINNITDDVVLDEVNVLDLGYGFGTPSFDEMSVGEWLVCVYVEEDGVETVYSNVCCLTITPKQGYAQNLPQKLSYKFSVTGEYQSEQNITLADNITDFSIVVEGENQSMANGILDGESGVWEFAQISELNNFIATDGNQVTEDDIISSSSNLVAGTNKYIPLRFNYNSENYADEVFLINLDIEKGDIVLPDVFWLGLEDDYNEITTYFSDNQKLCFAYSNHMDYYRTYFTVNEQISDASGTLNFVMKEGNASARYKFVNSSALEQKLINYSSNYKSVVYNPNGASVRIDWTLNPLVLQSNFSYEITDVQNKNALDEVISADAKIVIILSATEMLENDLEYANMFSYSINNALVDNAKLELNGNVAKLTTTISSFENDDNNVLVKLVVKNEFKNKIQIYVSNEQIANELESEVVIEKCSLLEQEISTAQIYASITLNEIKNLPYINYLYTYYSIEWLYDDVIVGENQNLDNRELVLSLTPINNFFVNSYDENYNYTMTYNPTNQKLVFAFISKAVQLSYDFGMYNITNLDGNEIVRQVKFDVTFAAKGLDQLEYGKDESNNPLYIVQISVSDSNASINKIEYDGQKTFSITLDIDINDYDEEGFCEVGFLIELDESQVNNYYVGARLQSENYNYYVYKYEITD